MKKTLLLSSLLLLVLTISRVDIKAYTNSNYDFLDNSRDYSLSTEKTLYDSSTDGALSSSFTIGTDGITKVSKVSGDTNNYNLAIEHDSILNQNVLVSTSHSVGTSSKTRLETGRVAPVVTDGTTGNSTALSFRVNFDYDKMQVFDLQAYIRTGGLISGSNTNTGNLLQIKWISGAGTHFYFGNASSATAATPEVENVYKRWDDFQLNNWYDFVLVFRDLGDATQDRVDFYVDGEFMFSRVGLPTDFNQNIENLFFHQQSVKPDANEHNTIKFANIYSAKVNEVVGLTGTDVAVDSDTTFDSPVTIDATNTQYDATLGFSSVLISDPTILSYYKYNNTFTAGVVTETTNVTVTFEALDANQQVLTKQVVVTVEPLTVDILPESIQRINLLGDLHINVNQVVDVSHLFNVLPLSTTDKSLNYEIKDGSTNIATLSGSLLTGVSEGTVTLVAKSVVDPTIVLEVTVTVRNGVYTALNNFVVGTIFTDMSATTIVNGWTAKGYGSKAFGDVEMKSDDIFTSIITVNGEGTVANGGGSYASGDFSIDELQLNANSDYILTGYIKVDGQSLGSQRADIKLYAMKDVDGTTASISSEAPFYQVLQIGNSQAFDNGWMYFETGPINLDLLEGVSAIHMELISYNNDENVTTSFAGLSLLEQSTVQAVSIHALQNDVMVSNLELTLGDSVVISGQSVPSTAITTFEFESLDPSIVTIDANGELVAVGTGSTSVLVKSGTMSYKVDVVVDNPITTIDADKTELQIQMSQNELVSLTIAPLNYLDVLVFTYSVDGVAAHTIDGTQLTVLPQSIGETVLTISSQANPTVKVVITITVTDDNVNGIDVLVNSESVEDIEMIVGDTLPFTVKIDPITRLDKAYNVTITDDSIVTINENNEFVALSAGTTAITFELDGVTQVITITVKAVIEEFEVTTTDVNLTVGETANLDVTFVANNDTVSVVYTSVDETIATVDQEGVITAISSGTTTVKVTAGDIEFEITVVIAAVEETATSPLLFIIPGIAFGGLGLVFVIRKYL